MRVNRQVLIAVICGPILAVPLMWLLANALFPLPQVQTIGGRPISPVLTEEDRQRLQTYHRECLHKADCEPPLGCLLDPRAGWFYCTDSQCLTDAQCSEGFSCQPLPTNEAGPLVRYCIPLGIGKEGETCISVPTEQKEACEPGLLCAKGWCGRPCQLDDARNCPEGFFCGDTIPGPACLPTCEGRTCPEGTRCISDNRTGASSCAVVYGEDCQQHPCSPGQKCMPVFGDANHVWMECFPQCNKGLPPCPEGSICNGRVCRKACDPKGPNVCEPGFTCQSRVPQQPWMCQPDM